MTKTAIPQKPTRVLHYLSLLQENRQQRLPWWKSFLGDPDYRQGKRDARRSPAAWENSLAGIHHEETLKEREIDNVLAQTTRDARDTLSRFADLHDRTRRKIEELRENNELLPEPLTITALRNGAIQTTTAGVLLLIEIVGLTYVCMQSMDFGFVPALGLTVLLAGLVAFGVSQILNHVPLEKKQVLKRILPSIGLLLLVTGMVGFVLLRVVSFGQSLDADGAIDLSQLKWGNLLLGIGLTLGVPMMVGILHEDGSEKRRKGQNSLSVYEEGKLLKEREAEWQSVLGKLEEYEKQLPELTACRIRNRQHNYRKGFFRRAGKDPQTAPYIQAMIDKRYTESSFPSL